MYFKENKGFNYTFLKMIKDKNESKILTKDIYANVNVNLIGNVI